MKIEVKYFALLREALGVGSEVLELEDEVATVQTIRDHLCRENEHKDAFERVKRIRAAVNGEMAPMSAAVADGDTVAFFPPVTGG